MTIDQWARNIQTLITRCPLCLLNWHSKGYGNNQISIYDLAA